MTLLPQTAFARTLALLLTLAAFILAGTLLVGGAYRARAWADLVGTLATARLQLIAPIVATLGPADAARFVAEEYAPEGLRLAVQPSGTQPAPFAERLLGQRLRATLGQAVEMRVLRDPDLVLWLRAPQTGGRWLAMPVPRRGEGVLAVYAVWFGVIAVIATLAALWFARQLSAPLRRLAAAAPALAQGDPPADLQPGGPRELRALGDALLHAARLARQLHEERELWLAGVSHDLRTPLARLRFAAEMLPDTLDLRAGMIEDVEAMDAMLGQFLDYLRLGRDEPVATCDVAALARTTLARFPDEATAHVAGELRAEVRPHALGRAIANLVTNAWRHGAPPVRLRVGIDHGEAFVVVHDEGAGFAAQRLANLSAPFVQGEATRSGAGSGLGLAIAARAAQMHGGELRAGRDDDGFWVGLYWPLDAGVGAQVA